MFIKYEAEVSSRVGGGERGVISIFFLFVCLRACFLLPKR